MKISAIVLALLTQLNLTSPSSAGPRIYGAQDPELVMQNSELKMYYSSEYSIAGHPSLPLGSIVRADCPHALKHCTNDTVVIGKGEIDAKRLRNPSVVVHSSGVYYIMYFSGEREIDGRLDDGTVYYATSFVTDGENWSKPRKLLSGLRKPSATVNEIGEIWLYGSRKSNDAIAYRNLGTSGVKTTGGYNAVTGLAGYTDVHIMYRSRINVWQVLAKRNDHQIDYLVSNNGTNFRSRRNAVVTTPRPQWRFDRVIRLSSPAPHPNTHSYVYVNGVFERYLDGRDLLGSSVLIERW